MESFETSCFGIITYVGTARSYFINAVQCAKKGNFEEAQELIRQEIKLLPKDIISMLIY